MSTKRKNYAWMLAELVKLEREKSFVTIGLVGDKGKYHCGSITNISRTKLGEDFPSISLTDGVTDEYVYEFYLNQIRTITIGTATMRFEDE